MHPDILETGTERVLTKIVAAGLLDGFYMVGGTALALQYGHRKSIDLDFFLPHDFSLFELKEKIATLDGILDGVKLTFLRYPYPLLFPLIPWEGVALADPRDIGCMKIDAISARGSRKDFVDLYVLLEQYPLRDILRMFEEKYAGIHYNTLHLVKSLSYFDDAEMEPMPIMLRSLEWGVVKTKISLEAKALIG
jgi:predicted nucleotidyltransferase component of viral defense system